MRVRFWGVRGAIAATQASAQGIGGNTPCVEVRGASGELVVLDAGIGLYWLGRGLLAGPHGRGQGRVSILLSHTHWDHIQGFPFFVPNYIPGNEVHLWGGVSPHLENILEGQLSPVYSPIASLTNMGASIEIHRIEDPAWTHDLGGLRLRHAVVHNGSHDCMAYRIDEPATGASVCYVAEANHDDRPTREVVELARGVDLLVHEAYYTNAEAQGRRVSLAGPSAPAPSGHSCHAEAVDAALAAGARRLLFFYHHPDHDDATIEAAVEAERARVAALGATLAIDAAREGLELDL